MRHEWGARRRQTKTKCASVQSTFSTVQYYCTPHTVHIYILHTRMCSIHQEMWTLCAVCHSFEKPLFFICGVHNAPVYFYIVYCTVPSRPYNSSVFCVCHIATVGVHQVQYSMYSTITIQNRMMGSRNGSKREWDFLHRTRKCSIGYEPLSTVCGNMLHYLSILWFCFVVWGARDVFTRVLVYRARCMRYGAGVIQYIGLA